jgi:hypothetical protein
MSPLLILAASAVINIASPAPQSQNVVIDTARVMRTEIVISWWERANIVCLNQSNGKVNQACLDRADLGSVLEKRGYCWTLGMSTAGHWAKCFVQGNRDYNGTDPSLEKYINDRNNFYLNTKPAK